MPRFIQSRITQEPPTVMRYAALALVVALSSSRALTQPAVEKIDTAAMSRIREEGLNRSHAAETLEGLTDVCGERLSFSPELKAAARWVAARLSSWKLDSVRIDPWTPAEKGWSIRRFSVHMIEPQTVPLIGVAKAWSPGTDGVVRGEAVYLDVKADSEFSRYHGKLKKAFVFISDPRPLGLDFTPFASRTPDSVLLKLANAEPGASRRRGLAFGDSATVRRFRQDALLTSSRLEFCRKEGARVIIDASRGDGGTIMTGAASVPQAPGTPYASRISSYDPKAPDIVPQVSLAAEHYNRIVRLLKQGLPVKMEMDLEVEFTSELQPGLNVLAEIPGTDLEDEVVMIGAHLDSWHAGTGACDNGTGVTTAMEAMRILSAIGLRPRRTIRIGLWSGEEQGLLGSKAFVTKYLGEREGDGRGDQGPVHTTPAYDKFCAYFNDDNGSGKFRGIYLQGNEGLRPVFRAWLAPFGDLGASTVTAANTGGTDHLSFDAIGLPAFQFIQDPLEYGRTYHTNFDTYERASEDDLKQSAVIMAAFAYDAAMREEKLPRKPMPEPQRTSLSQ